MASFRSLHPLSSVCICRTGRMEFRTCCHVTEGTQFHLMSSRSRLHYYRITFAVSVSGQVPSAWTIPKFVLKDELTSITFTGGSALNLEAGADSVKIVTGNHLCDNGGCTGLLPPVYNGTCIPGVSCLAIPTLIVDTPVDAPATGTNIINDLAGNSTSATSTSIQVSFPAIGPYKVCYKLHDTSQYQQIGPKILTVFDPPKKWSALQGIRRGLTSVITGIPVAVNFTGGTNYLNGWGQDTAKVVPAEGSCEDSPAAGTGVVDVTNSTFKIAGANFTFTEQGLYQFCYKLTGTEMYVTLGPTLVVSQPPDQWAGGT